MSYDIFKHYGLDRVHDSMTENFDYADEEIRESEWELVKVKSIRDMDGMKTEYAWYSNGSTNIFMFGDTDLYDPDPMYADHEEESDIAAEEWFESYTGFEEDDEDENFNGNADFLNDGFNRVFGDDLELED